jgi:cellulose synthase operon protein C
MTGPKKQTTGRPHDKKQSAAHLQRSGELAATGLFKEAAVLWEHAARLSPTPLNPAPFLVYLINSQQIERGTKLYFSQQAEIQNKHPKLVDNLLSLLGAHLLINTSKIKESIPKEHPLRTELKGAKACLGALSQGEHKQLDKQLQIIKEDSPYWQFANIIKSLACEQGNSEAMLTAISDIPGNSPFANLARVAGIRTLSGSSLARALMQIPPADQQLIAQMMVIPKPLLQLLNKLSTTKKSGQFLKALLEYTPPLPGPWVRDIYLDLLVENLDKRSKVEKQIGSLTPFENSRLLALHHQQKKHRVRSNTNWKQCLKLIKEQASTTENSLTIAQLHSHFASLEESAPWPSRLHIIEHLQEAQEHDPDDSQTVIRLIHWQQQDEDKTGLHLLVSQAIKRFPQNPDILMLASELAIDKKSYKKAAGLAKKAQKLAPHNSQFLTTQINSQLSHVRNQIKTGNLILARRELTMAQKSLLSHDSQVGNSLGAEVCILQSLLESLDGNVEESNAALNTGQKLAGVGPHFYLSLFLEAGQLLKDVDGQLLKYRDLLEQSSSVSINKGETIKIVTLGKDHFTDKNPMLGQAFTILRDYLTKAAKQDFSIKELTSLCSDLFYIEEHGILATFAKAAAKRWKDEPTFLFYHIYAESGGETYRISDEDFFALREALPTAVRRGDGETAHRIDKLMGQSPKGSRRSLSALSPAKIPKLVEKQLVKKLKKLIDVEFGPSRKSIGENSLRNLLLERLAKSEYASRGEFILAYLVDKALNREDGPTTKRKKKDPPPVRQLAMDLFE